MLITAEALAQQIGAEILGDGSRSIGGAQPLSKAGPEDVSFVMSEAGVKELSACRAAAVIISRALISGLGEIKPASVLLVVDDAQVAFIQALGNFRTQRPRPKIGVSPQAFVSATARIGEHTNISPGAWVGDDVVIGAGCDIYPGVFVGAGCRLGDEVTLHPNVVLYADIAIGSRVIVHASAVIGADGFGYRFENGRYIKIPQLGTVQIEDDVEIGAGTTIDRGMIGPTVIGAGSKIDNLVMIAHNCEVGKHNVFASQVALAGSVTTGDYVRCAGQVGVRDHVQLGKGCTVGAGSGVHKSIPAGATFLGYPARPETETLQIVMAESRLPHMRIQLRELQVQVKELSSRIEGLSRTDREEAA